MFHKVDVNMVRAKGPTEFWNEGHPDPNPSFSSTCSHSAGVAMVFCMDQLHCGHPQAAHYIYTLHPLKLGLASSGGIGPPLFTLWPWKCTSFQGQSQVPRVGKPSPALFPVSGGNVWGGYKAAECFSLAYLWSLHFPWPAAVLQLTAPPFQLLPGSAWNRCSGLCCRQTEHLGMGQGDAPGTALGGKEQKVTGSPRAVSVSAHDLSSLKKSF